MNDIASPLRLAVGPHKAGSGKGCAMNVISWENGDKQITDFPSCTAHPLARLVQIINDKACSHTTDGLLCPPCSITVLDLAHSAVGTGNFTGEQLSAWLDELINSPEWGRGQYSNVFGTSAASAANAIVAALFAIDAASAASAPSAAITIAASAASAANASAATVVSASGASVIGVPSLCERADARLKHARAAIAAWHRICGTSPAVPSPEVVQKAVEKMCRV